MRIKKRRAQSTRVGTNLDFFFDHLTKIKLSSRLNADTLFGPQKIAWLHSKNPNYFTQYFPMKFGLLSPNMAPDNRNAGGYTYFNCTPTIRYIVNFQLITLYAN